MSFDVDLFWFVWCLDGNGHRLDLFVVDHALLRTCMSEGGSETGEETRTRWGSSKSSWSTSTKSRATILEESVPMRAREGWVRGRTCLARGERGCR